MLLSPFTLRAGALLALSLSAAAAPPQRVTVSGGGSVAGVTSSAAPTDREDVAHFLGRMTNGVRLDDARSLLAGYPGSIVGFIDAQLDPTSIPETRPELAALLADVTPDRMAGEEWTIDLVVKEFLARGLFSRRQLQHVLGYFWKRHFSTDYNKLARSLAVIAPMFPAVPGTPEEQAATLVANEVAFFRDNALGSFETLLLGSAQGASMLLYLDGAANCVSAPGQKANENYARELLELHTMGLDPVSGLPTAYTETDIEEIAKILSGWTIQADAAPYLEKYVFRFDPACHDTSPRIDLFTVSAVPLPAGSLGSGRAEGETVLSHLAGKEETARFISRKLYAFFISEDEPPSALIDDCVSLWQSPPAGFPVGSIELVVERLLKSGAMYAPANRRSKMEMPLEAVLSTVRFLDGSATTGAQLDSLVSLLDNDLGQPLFRFPSPDGFPIKSARSTTSTQILQRINFDQTVYNGWTPPNPYLGEISYDPLAFFQRHGIPLDDEAAIVDFFLEALTQGNASATDRALALDFLQRRTDGSPAARTLADLIAAGDQLEWADRIVHFLTYVTSIPQAFQK